jgi:renalase
MPLPARPDRLTLEIAVSTPGEAVLAETNGADRLELSSGLELGGLTPSLNLFRSVREVVSIPIVVLIRPRPGGFNYSDREFDDMLRDAAEFMQEGASGIVFGVLDRNRIDRERCKRFVKVAEGRAVFHRAFDFLPNLEVALDELIELGFQRVLTSGQANTALVGAARLASLIQHVGSRIEVLSAGNIRPDTVVEVVQKTGCSQVHSSARTAVLDPGFSNSLQLCVGMGADAEGMRMTTNAELVAGLRDALNRLGA